MELTFLWQNLQIRKIICNFLKRKKIIFLCHKLCVLQTKYFEIFLLVNLKGVKIIQTIGSGI
jgi:hypothetical protein